MAFLFCYKFIVHFRFHQEEFLLEVTSYMKKKIHVILSVTCLPVVNVVERKITSTHVKFYDINFILNKGTLLSLSNE